VPISSQALPGIPYDDSGKVLIVQQEKLLKSAVSDYIDRIVNRRGPRQRVITQPRPIADIEAARRVVALAENCPHRTSAAPSKCCTQAQR
jgi:hypothetical protein